MQPDGDGLRRIVADGAEPDWSPDGKAIAFASDRDRNGQTCFEECQANSEIYVVDLETSEQARLTANGADDRAPAWSPDGETIAFSSDRSNRRKHETEIYAMAADGSGVRRLTTAAAARSSRRGGRAS